MFPLSPLLLRRFYFFLLLFTLYRSPLSERLEQASQGCSLALPYFGFYLTLTLSQSIITQKIQYTTILTLGLVINAYKSFLFYPILFILESHLKKRREGSLENKKLMRLKILIVGDQQIHYHLFYNSPEYMDDTMFKYLYRTR